MFTLTNKNNDHRRTLQLTFTKQLKKFHKNMMKSSKSGESCCRRASSIRLVVLNIRSETAELAGIAKREQAH